VDSALTYIDISDPAKIDGPKDFQKAFGKFAFSFNWFYLDNKHIAFVLGGTYPKRTKGVSRSFPTWGNNRWDWRGRLGYDALPKDISPSKGYMTSWNNKQAPGWGAGDDTYSFGPLYRSLLLDDGIKKAAKNGNVSLVELVNAMGSAATVDLRGDKVLPLMLKVIGNPGNERMAKAVNLMNKWVKAGSHRRDRNGDGSYDNAAAVALMDAWWEPVLDAIFGPRLGDAMALVPQGRDDEPGPLGSAYHDGWYGYANKDLRSVLGRKVRGKYSVVYCGRGNKARCREDLIESLDFAMQQLEAEFGADPATWEADEEGDQIDFRALGIQDQENMRWQNRPTFQMVMEFND
jgi:acyl-homoserine lactone acylase PvdQ